MTLSDIATKLVPAHNALRTVIGEILSDERTNLAVGTVIKHCGAAIEEMDAILVEGYKR